MPGVTGAGSVAGSREEDGRMGSSGSSPSSEGSLRPIWSGVCEVTRTIGVGLWRLRSETRGAVLGRLEWSWSEAGSNLRLGGGAGDVGRDMGGEGGRVGGRGSWRGPRIWVW